jgi:threonine/homoserine/homoserine lactone efflux protein
MDGSGWLSIVGKGILLGFAIAAPVGPIGVLVIRRTLVDGRRIGFVSGLGAATADLLYGALAAFGLAALTGWLVDLQYVLAAVGGVYLLYLGVRSFTSPPPEAAAALGQPRPGYPGAYFSTLVLTLMNPATILSFVAIFAGLGLASAESSFAGAGLLVLGVFLGSAAWWLLLSTLVGQLRGRLGTRALLWVNRLAGVVLAGFGLAALAAGLSGL